MKQVSVRLDEEVIKELKTRAVNSDTTFQDVVGKALMKYIDPKTQTFYEIDLGTTTLRLTRKEYNKLIHYIVSRHVPNN